VTVKNLIPRASFLTPVVAVSVGVYLYIRQLNDNDDDDDDDTDDTDDAAADDDDGLMTDRLSPSKAMLTISTAPPVGFVMSPIRPFPIPLKKPSTPSSFVPTIQPVTLTDAHLR